jgi:hypothetical protein
MCSGFLCCFDEFVHGGDIAKITASLENILRIRAVQDMKPSQALAFVLQFKGLIREELKGGKPLNGLSGELQAFERKIDDLVLLAFDPPWEIGDRSSTSPRSRTSS